MIKIAEIDLGNYQWNLSLNDKDFTKGLEKAEKSSGKLTQFLKVGLAGALTAVGAAAGGLLAITTKSAEATDRIDKLSQKLGLSREGFQELDFVLSQSGTSIDSMQAGMKSLTTLLDDASKGGDKSAETFAKLGLSLDDISNMSQEQSFEAIVKSLQEMEDGAEKAALANKIFGKSGQELMPLLNSQAGSFEELKNKAHDLGLVLSDEAIDSGVLFTDTMDQVKRMLGSITTQIGTNLMTIVQKLLEGVMQYMPQIQTIFSVVFGVLGTLVTGFIEGISLLIGWLKSWYENNAETVGGIRDTLIDFFEAVSEFFTAFIGFVSNLWEKYGADILAITQKYFEMISKNIESVLNIIKGIFNFFAGLFTGDWEKMGKALKDIVQNVWDLITNIFESALEIIFGILKLAGNILLDLGKAAMNFLWDSFKSVWDSITSWFSDVVKNLFSWFGQKTSDFKNIGISWFNALWSGLESVWQNIRSWINDTISWLTDKLFFWRSSQAEMSGGYDDYGYPYYQQGTPFVPNDGLAFLHKGEAVIPAAYNPFNPNNPAPAIAGVGGGDTYNISVGEVRTNDARKFVSDLLHMSRIS